MKFNKCTQLLLQKFKNCLLDFFFISVLLSSNFDKTHE